MLLIANLGNVETSGISWDKIILQVNRKSSYDSGWFRYLCPESYEVSNRSGHCGLNMDRHSFGFLSLKPEIQTLMQGSLKYINISKISSNTKSDADRLHVRVIKRQILTLNKSNIISKQKTFEQKTFASLVWLVHISWPIFGAQAAVSKRSMPIKQVINHQQMCCVRPSKPCLENFTLEKTALKSEIIPDLFSRIKYMCLFFSISGRSLDWHKSIHRLTFTCSSYLFISYFVQKLRSPRYHMYTVLECID